MAYAHFDSIPINLVDDSVIFITESLQNKPKVLIFAFNLPFFPRVDYKKEM